MLGAEASSTVSVVSSFIVEAGVTSVGTPLSRWAGWLPESDT